VKEFMLLIRNDIDHQAAWSADQHAQFLKACESYIGRLKDAGHLIAAQPLVREGTIISGKPGAWREKPLNKTGEVQVGYYHLLADGLADAVSLAKENPEFVYSTTASIEVRPVKTNEETTRFVYPNQPR
jgi:hypothetical protein